MKKNLFIFRSYCDPISPHFIYVIIWNLESITSRCASMRAWRMAGRLLPNN